MKQFTQNWGIRPSKNLGLEVILDLPHQSVGFDHDPPKHFSFDQPAGPLGGCRGVTDFEAPNAV